jgi:NAD(P)-dependent dehydrogenase (short-subunit alcohol dehydrogenase family)
MSGPKKLQDKVAVITGGTTGIGLATAKLFVKEGAYVFITGRRQKELDEAVRAIGSNVTGVQGDIAKLTDLDRLYEVVATKGRIDVVFANAGVAEFAPLARSLKSILTSCSTSTSRERCSRCRRLYRY